MIFLASKCFAILEFMSSLQNLTGNCDIFTIGFLSGNRDRYGKTSMELPGLRISPAIHVAVEEINKSDPPYLPHGHKLK